MILQVILLVSLATIGIAFPSKMEGPGLPCGIHTCGDNAVCKKEQYYDFCECKPGFYGSGFGKGCTSKPECTDDSGCADDKACNSNNLCHNPCILRCADVGCRVRNHAAECIFDGLHNNPLIKPKNVPAF